MNIKSLIAGVALAALSTSAFAGAVTLPDLTVPDVGSASVSGSAPSVKGSFDEIFVVDIIGAFSALTASVTASNTSSGTWDLYSGAAPNGAILVASSTFSFGGSTFGSVQDTVGGASGFYYAELKGVASGAVAPGVSFTATSVPELSTWGMMLAGFSALGFAGFRRRPVAVAVA